MTLIAIDNAGAERFVAAFEDGSTKAYPDAISIVDELEPGSVIVLETGVYTSNAVGKRDEKNAAFLNHARAKRIILKTIGSRITKKYSVKQTGETPHHKCAKGILAAYKQRHKVQDGKGLEREEAKHPSQTWPSKRVLDSDLFVQMSGMICEIRADKARMKWIGATIKDSLTPDELKCFKKSSWSEALIAGLYYAAVNSKNRKEYMTLLGAHGQGKPCYLRALIIRRMFRKTNDAATRRITVRACRKVRLALGIEGELWNQSS